MMQGTIVKETGALDSRKPAVDGDVDGGRLGCGGWNPGQEIPAALRGCLLVEVSRPLPDADFSYRTGWTHD